LIAWTRAIAHGAVKQADSFWHRDGEWNKLSIGLVLSKAGIDLNLGTLFEVLLLLFLSLWSPNLVQGALLRHLLLPLSLVVPHEKEDGYNLPVAYSTIAG
jgi:hypothetical protein